MKNYEDLTGQKFGKWTVVGSKHYITPSKTKVLKWVCRCECGTETLVLKSDLNKGKSTQCRKCCGTAPRDLSGNEYGRWNVISCDIIKLNRRYCICNCYCGNNAEVAAQTLLNGTSTQCLDCYNKERLRHPLYSIWHGMIARCENKKHICYHLYGGRGIKACKRWHSLFNFANDMGLRPTNRHTLERVDNSKGYSPYNCKWATYTEQANNKRSNRILTYKNESLNLTQWAKRFNINVDTLWRFLTRNSFAKAYKHYSNNKKEKYEQGDIFHNI